MVKTEIHLANDAERDIQRISAGLCFFSDPFRGAGGRLCLSGD